MILNISECKAQSKATATLRTLISSFANDNVSAAAHAAATCPPRLLTLSNPSQGLTLGIVWHIIHVRHTRKSAMPQHVAMASNGRLVIPANVRSELGMPDGGNFIVHVEDGHIRLEPIQSAVARAQAIVRRYVPEDVSLVDELTEDRRRESEGE